MYMKGLKACRFLSYLPWTWHKKGVKGEVKSVAAYLEGAQD